MRDKSVRDIAALGAPVGRLTDGDAFGEQSFLTGGVSLATVRTITFCEIMSLHNKDLSTVFASYPSLQTELKELQQTMARPPAPRCVPTPCRKDGLAHLIIDSWFQTFTASAIVRTCACLLVERDHTSPC